MFILLDMMYKIMRTKVLYSTIKLQNSVKYATKPNGSLYIHLSSSFFPDVVYLTSVTVQTNKKTPQHSNQSAIQNEGL